MKFVNLNNLRVLFLATKFPFISHLLNNSLYSNKYVCNFGRESYLSVFFCQLKYNRYEYV
jgi:hypothetical protein